MNFDDSIKKLEAIVSELENGDLPIEKSIEEFEKGILIVKDARAFLDKAQEQVTTLIEEINHEKKAD